MDEEILKAVKEKGLLLEKDVMEILEGFGDVKKVKEFLDNLERYSGQKMITKSVLSSNFEFVKGFVSKLEDEEKGIVEKTFIKMGIKLEVERTKFSVPTTFEKRKELKIEKEV